MTASASLITAEEVALPAAPATRRADVLQWEEIYRGNEAVAAEIPEDFADIDALVERREREPRGAERLARARERLEPRLQGRIGPLAALRLRKGWSQKQLAAAIGTSQPHIARIENGRDNVLLGTANDLARALGVSLEEINTALGYHRRTG